MHRTRWSRGPEGLASARADVFSHIFNVGRINFRNLKPGAKPCQPLTIAAFLYLDAPLPVEVIRPAFMERVVSKIMRLRAVTRMRRGWTHFDEVAPEDLDLDYHFFTITETLDTEEQWEALVSSWSKMPMDGDKPMWRIGTAQRLPCGRPAIVMLVDHTVADGLSLVEMACKMLCDGFRAPQRTSTTTSTVADEHMPSRPGLFGRMLRSIRGVNKALFEPFSFSDRPNSLKMKGNVPEGYTFATCPIPLCLNKIKEIKRMVPGTTVNDVMLSLSALSVAQFFKERDEPLYRKKKDIQTTFIVETRPRDAAKTDDKWFGNDFVATSMVYPLHDGPIKTLLRCHRSTTAIKTTADIPIRAFVRDRVLPLVPNRSITDIAADINCKFTGNTSNVFVSDSKLFIAGVGIDDVRFATFTPFGLYIGISTYNGKVSYNIVLAKDLGVNPHDLARHIAPQLDDLYTKVWESANPGIPVQFPPSTAAVAATTASQSAKDQPAKVEAAAADSKLPEEQPAAADVTHVLAQA